MKKLLLLSLSLLASNILANQENIYKPFITQPTEQTLELIKNTRALLDLSWKFLIPRKNQEEADQLLKEVIQLLQKPINVDARIETGLYFETGYLQTESALQRAQQFYPEIAELLIKYGANPKGYSPEILNFAE